MWLLTKNYRALNFSPDDLEHAVRLSRRHRFEICSTLTRTEAVRDVFRMELFLSPRKNVLRRREQRLRVMACTGEKQLCILLNISRY